VSASAEAAAPVQLSLLDAVCTPLPQGGEDPRYRDEFLLAKREIDKLHKNDYELIHDLCCALLSRQGKDLRVAGFLVMAALGRDGMTGLIDAAEGYRQLLEHFWDDCHPRKESLRVSAVNWLNGARFEAMAHEAGCKASVDQRGQLRRNVDEINRLLSSRLGDEAPRWRSMDDWLKADPPADPEPPAAVGGIKNIPASLSRGGKDEAQKNCASPGQESAIGSEREAFAMTRALSRFFSEQGNRLQAAAFNRALRWGGLMLPPHDQGQTRVPAPRDGAVAAFEHQCRTDDPKAMLDLCESLFMEPGGQFWLDLQHQCSQAAGGAGLEDLQRFIDGQVRLLLERFPDLASLDFEDGRPFASPATRCWLDELENIDSRAADQPKPAGLDDWDAQLTELVGNARSLAVEKKLSQALNLIRTLPAQNKAQRLRLQLAQTEICLQGGRPDVASPLAENLEEQSAILQVEHWDQSLALEIWRTALETFQQCLRRAAPEDKALLNENIRCLRARICRADPAVAVKWL
jgi:type VI secretion system protein VasJ